MAKRVTTEERERIIEAFATGKSCNQIAKDFGRSPGTISNIAREEGHDFGYANLQHAHEINSRYGAEWRANTRQRLSDQIHREIAAFTEPHLVYAFGGRDNVYNEHEIPKPDARARRDMSATITSLWRVVKEMDEYESKQVDRAAFDTIFAQIDRMADEYERTTMEPETGPHDQPE